MHRRELLRGLAGSTALFSAAYFPTRSSGREPIRRSGPSRFQIGLAAYSLRDYFAFMRGKPRRPKEAERAIDMFGFLDYCVAQGFDTAELTSYFFPPEPDTAYLLSLKQSAYLRGLAISGTAIGNNFTLGKGPRFDAEVQSAIEWIDRAAVLGAPHIRFFAGTRSDLEKSPKRFDEAIEAIEVCAAHAAAKGIFLGVENHGNLTSAQMLEIMRRVESPWVGINLDTGNFHSEDPYADLAACAPYAVNVQVKVSMKSPGGRVDSADLPRIGNILKDAGYQGFVVLEYEDSDPYKNIPQAHEDLRNALES